LLDAAGLADVRRRIFEPLVRALSADGRPFRGVLYGGLILTPDRGPMVIEWNARFGDPETQVVMARLGTDLLPWLWGAARGRLPDGELVFDRGSAVCVVLAAAGYPGTPRGGDAIEGLAAPLPAEVQVFHAGTRREGNEIVSAGGRVLGVTARGNGLTEARARAYAVIGRGSGRVGFEGMHYRRDIGLRGAS
jgi:phosphoribosylamine--glycine ligase